MAAPPPPLQEVVIGTDSGINTGNAAAWHDDEHQPRPPALAEVEVHVASLLELVTNGNMPIEATCIHLIDTIVDQLDQVYYWALEEGSTFLHEPSVLAQCEVPRLVVLCVLTRRPKIMVAALRIMRHLLRHEQAGAHVFAAAAAAAATDAEIRDDADNGDAPAATHGRAFYSMLADAMNQCAGLVQLQVEAAAVASEAARLDIEGLLENAVISHVLASLCRHGENAAMQVEGLRLFATLVDIPREVSVADNADAAPPTPTAVLLSHVGVVVQFVLRVAKANADNIEVKGNAVHFFRRCASYPENVLVLMQNGMYPFLVAALPAAAHVPELFVELTEAIAAFAPLLDPLQRRSLALAVRRVLLRTTSSFFLSLCVALLVRVLKASSSDCGAEPQVDAVQMTASQRPASISQALVELRPSARIILADDDTCTFMTSNWIPQLLCHAAETVGEDDPTLQRTVAEAVRLLCHFKWQ